MEASVWEPTNCDPTGRMLQWRHQGGMLMKCIRPTGTATRVFAGLAMIAVSATAQEGLSLAEAIRLATSRHPAIVAAEKGVKAAENRIDEARSGYLPKLNYSESFTRSNNPVFVFSSLLTQHQFTANNFALGPLNRPDPLNNFQSTLGLDQVVFDAGQTRNAVTSAELNRNVAGEDERKTRMDVIANVVRTYWGAVLAEESVNVANEAVQSAEADLQRAESVRRAGMSTDADVLSIRVHLAQMKEEQIRRTSDVGVAVAALNEAIGMPLSAGHRLVTVLTPAEVKPAPIEEYENASVKERPEARQAALAVGIAQTQVASARGSLMPQVVVHGAFEVDRQRFVDRGGANWLASASLRWDIFNGGANKARIGQAEAALERARAEQARASSLLQLQTRKAYADRDSSRQRIEVAQATIAMAEESLRITKNRFNAGLTDITTLLRSETALLQARTDRLAAIYDERMAAVALALAAGALTEESDAVK